MIILIKLIMDTWIIVYQRNYLYDRHIQTLSSSN